MQFDLNEAKNQSSSIHLIPESSKVFVKLSIIYPKEDARGSSRELTKRSSGMEQLCVKLEVVRGRYANTYFYHNFSICGASTDGQYKGIEISKSHLRAFVEANFFISPQDTSEEAIKVRQLGSLSEIEGFVAPVLVGREVNKQGFLHNKLKSVVTINDEEYNTLITNGEIIAEE